MRVTPDFSEASDLQTPFPEAIYKARITKCEMKKSKTSGNDYLNWELSVFGADGELSKFNKRNIFMITMLSGAGAGRLRDLIKAATGSTEIPQDFDTDELIGKEIQVMTKMEYDQDGNPRSNPGVKKVTSL